MPLPSNLPTVTVTGHYLDFEGNPIDGQVEITPATILTDPAGDAILAPTTFRLFLQSGAFSIELPVTDDPDAHPTGFTYRIREVFRGGRTWSFMLPSALAGQTVDIADLAAVDTTPGASAFMSEAQANQRFIPLTQRAAASGVATLDGAGTIPDAQIPAAITRDTELTDETNARIAADALMIPLAQKGAASGVATLDGAGLIPDAQIPAAIARDTEVAAAVAALVASAPATLDTLAEVGTALGNDPNLATTLTTSIGTKIPLTQRAAANGVATLDGAGLIPDAQIPATIARDTEVAAGYAALAGGNSFTGTQTITDANAGVSNLLLLRDFALKQVFTVDSGGGLHLGHASAEALLNLHGNAPYGANDDVVWQSGLDVANAPFYRDYVMAARVEGPGSVSDFVILRHGFSVGDPPRLGVGGYPTDAEANKGVIQSTVWGTTNGLTFHNYVAKVRDSTAPVQTGHAFAISRENNEVPWAASVIGRQKVRQITNLLLTDAHMTTDSAAALFSPMANTKNGLVLKLLSGQTSAGMALRVENDSSVLKAGFDGLGRLFLTHTSTIADADIPVNSMGTVSFDGTIGAAGWRFKGKNHAGTVVTAFLPGI